MKDNSFLALPIPVRMSKLYISMHFYANRLHGLAWFCISLFIISAFVHVISCVTWVTQESTQERRRIWALSYSDAHSMCANLCIFGYFKHAGLCSWITLNILFTIHLCVVKFRQVDANHFTENNVGLFFSATHNSSIIHLWMQQYVPHTCTCTISFSCWQMIIIWTHTYLSCTSLPASCFHFRNRCFQMFMKYFHTTVVVNMDIILMQAKWYVVKNLYLIFHKVFFR